MIGKDRFLFWGRIAACGHSWAGWLVTLESKRAPTECAAVLCTKLGSPKLGKMADDVRSKRVHAYRDRRPDVSLLGLFSYDRFSAVLPEKGWILPLDSSLSKLVPPRRSLP